MSKVKIRRQAGGPIDFWEISLRVVAFEKAPRKQLQPLECGMAAALPRLHRSNTTVKVLPVSRDVLMHGISMKSSRPLPLIFGMQIFVSVQILRQQTIQPRTNGVCPILRPFHQLRRNNNIGIHCPERNPDLRSQTPPPSLRLTHRIFVPNQKCRTHIHQQLLVRLMRSPSHDKRDVARRKIRFDVRQALIEKRIVPKIGVGEIGDPRKINNQRQTKQVCDLYRQVDSMVVDTALSTLHPVNATSSVAVGCPISTHIHTWIAGPAKKFLGQIRPHLGHDPSLRGTRPAVSSQQKMRPEGRIPVKTTLLPETPGTTDVVAQRHRNQHKKREEAGGDSQLDQFRLIFNVHEKQNNDDRLRASDSQRYYRIEYSKIDIRCRNGERSPYQQRNEDNRIGHRLHDVMLSMLRIRYVRRVMIFGHYLYPSSQGLRLQSRLRAGVTVDQVEQRKQEQPHNIDKVPIQSEILNRCDVPGTELSSVGPPCKPEQQADADNHVQCVHACHRKIE